jgi:NADH-ubiquinone oxidoreductase chain 4
MLFARSNVLVTKTSSNQFVLYILALAGILSITFRASNIIIFYISFESSLIPTLLLIIGWGYQPERIQAGVYIILYTIAASLPLLIRILFIYSSNRSLFIFSQIFEIRLPSNTIKF